MANLELKQFVENKEFVETMNSAFANLRADFELTLDSSDEEIYFLKSLHVDIKNNLSNLISLSKKSSGVLSGLRGTGKTHLMLLARHEINKTLLATSSENNFCIYLNMRRLVLPENFTKDIFNRKFSLFIYESMTKQLIDFLSKDVDCNFFKKIIKKYSKKDRILNENIKKLIGSLCEIKIVSMIGNNEFYNIEKGTITSDIVSKELIKLSDSIRFGFNKNGIAFDMDLSDEYVNEVTNKFSSQNNYLQFMDYQIVREKIINIIHLLDISSITFYIDEWEKVYPTKNVQEYSADYINHIIDSPILFWLSVVPSRDLLFTLSRGADLVHTIDLDDCLILESSELEKDNTINYFKELLNKRLVSYFKDPNINLKLLFNNNESFNKLIIACMGNIRDFGTMVFKCWSEYKAYRTTSTLSVGRPYKYINNNMVIAAIKDNGQMKINNLEGNEESLKVWDNIRDFCIQKKSSHFVIEETPENLDVLREDVFNKLIYNRLLHLRKRSVPQKDSGKNYKLSVYAINYASTYALHSQDKKFDFILDYDSIHNKVRRYIYNPKDIVNQLKIQSGTIVNCPHCSKPINLVEMKAMWELNFCPYCVKKIRSE